MGKAIVGMLIMSSVIVLILVLSKKLTAATTKKRNLYKKYFFYFYGALFCFSGIVDLYEKFSVVAVLHLIIGIVILVLNATQKEKFL